jgi:hypothetical protein
MEVEPEFNLNGKLLGPKGQYLRNITMESGGAKVHLRGRDSTANASEADQLHIYITANSQVVLDRAKKLAGDLIANVQKQYEEYKQKKAAGPQYPMVPGYPMPFMPPYPYGPFAAFGGYPPFPGRPPYGYPPRGPAVYPPVPAGPGYPPPLSSNESVSSPQAYPNYYPETTNSNTTDSPSKTETNSETTNPSTAPTDATAETGESYMDPLNYYNYGYSHSAGYEQYHYPNYGYYPGMEDPVTAEKTSSDPANGGVEGGTVPTGNIGQTNVHAYDYNYAGVYEDEQNTQQQYGGGYHTGSAATYYHHDQNSSNQN